MCSVVEYALRDQRRPMGVADWETQLVEKLPDALKGSLARPLLRSAR
jgi:hypothetical protein